MKKIVCKRKSKYNNNIARIPITRTHKTFGNDTHFGCISQSINKVVSICKMDFNTPNHIQFFPNTIVSDIQNNLKIFKVFCHSILS